MRAEPFTFKNKVLWFNLNTCVSVIPLLAVGTLNPFCCLRQFGHPAVAKDRYGFRSFHFDSPSHFFEGKHGDAALFQACFEMLPHLSLIKAKESWVLPKHNSCCKSNRKQSAVIASCLHLHIHEPKFNGRLAC